jgi:hypothetical protein
MLAEPNPANLADSISFLTIGDILIFLSSTTNLLDSIKEP